VFKFNEFPPNAQLISDMQQRAHSLVAKSTTPGPPSAHLQMGKYSIALTKRAQVAAERLEEVIGTFR